MLDPKKLAASLALMMTLGLYGYGQTDPIGILINSPSQTPPGHPQVVGDNMSIVVDVPATYQIDSVIASVPGAPPLLLTYNTTSGEWTGTMSLLGLPMGTTTLTIRAVDIYNNSATSTGQFIYDHPPVLTLDSPANYTVAVPNLHVRSRCQSPSGACTITVTLIGATTLNATLGTYTDSVDVKYDLSAYEGMVGGANNLQLDVSAADSYGVAANSLLWVPVYVENSPYLTPVFTADGPIFDLSGTKIFVGETNSSNGTSPLHIIDFTNGSVTKIPFTGGSVSTGHLTSTGVVFNGESLNEEPGGYPNIFEWHNGSLDSLGLGSTLGTAAGDYAIYTPSTGGTVLRNLATQTNQSIPNTWSAPYPTASGIMGYETAGSKSGEVLFNLFNSGTGASTQVADDTSGNAYGPLLTDGTNVLYVRYAQSVQWTATMFGSSGNYFDVLAQFPPNTVTGTPTAIVPKPGTYFQINNGYSAYLDPSSQGVNQVWFRDTTGKKMQLTFYGSTYPEVPVLETMNPKGQFSFFSDTTIGRIPSGQYNTLLYRYMYTPSAGYLPIGGNQGQAYYTDSTWYVVIGWTVFRLNLAAVTPNKSDNFSVNVKPNTAYGFTAGNFTSHFEGSGELKTVTFTRRPSHGTLSAPSGFQVDQNNNWFLYEYNLPTLVYTPANGFTGVDTVYWYGANGFTGSTDTAMLLLNVGVNPLPPAPQISGLGSDYCQNAAAQQVTITNMPANGSGITVTGTLDGQAVTVAAGGVITLQPQTLAVGTHNLAVIFSNAAGADTTSASFKVDAPATPVVSLSADPSTVSGATQQVVLTATDVSGGGTQPLYTFARDAGVMNIVQAESTTSTVTISASSLAVGNNVFYVRMRTSDTCYTTQTGMDSVVVVVTAPPPPPPVQPAITGLDSVYCSNGGTAVFMMSNFPDTAGGATVVTDTLDNGVLAIGSGASCSITLSGLSAGVHTVKVTYTNTGGSSSVVSTFTLVAASTPDVGLSASYTTMPDTAASVVVRASDVSGGGSLPQYTFALNGNFSPVLYGPGGADSVVIDSAALAIGANTVYVRMQTSDSCYTALNATGSMVITRTADTTHVGGTGGGNNTNDSTSSTLAVGPNPFQDQLTISGLQSTHAYTISLLNGNGMETVRVQVGGVGTTSFFAGAVPSGIYLLRIYDETTGKVSRMVKLMGLRK